MSSMKGSEGPVHACGSGGILHGLCLKNSCNLPANLGFGVEFHLHGGHGLRGSWPPLASI